MLSSSWVIELASEQPAARFAARELQATLARMGAPLLPISAAAQGPRIALRHGPAGDGFVRGPDAGGFNLRGDGPRGLLYAVYDLLEALGCRWPAPGADAEHIPVCAPLRLPEETVADRPAIGQRGLIIGHDHFLAEAENWIIWAARNRLNTIFIHTTIRAPALGACRLAAWRARRHEVLPLIRERGLRLELGGHHLRDLLPRRLFRTQPTLFRHNGQRRSPDHNFCVSNPAALAYVQRTAAAFFAAYPEAEIYHLWPDDLRAGGWCQCPACAKLSPADQALIAANALAAVLPEGRTAARVAYLAYHDTEAPPQRTPPHPRVTPIFAPRLRSYAAGMDAPVNAGVAARLAGCVAACRAAAEGAAVFEYYLDGILFKSSPPPLAEVIAADMAHYQAAGVSAVHVLLTGDRPFIAAPPNAYLFARLAWAPTAEPQAIMAEYAAARAPGSGSALAAAYAALAEAWRPALARDPEQEPAPGAPGLDPVAQPPADVLDPIAEPRRAAERRLEAMRATAEHLTHGQALWETMNRAELAAERAEWELSAALLHFLRLRQQLYVLVAREAPRTLIVEALDEARAALNALLAWAARHVPARAQGGHLLLRAALQLQLDHVADRHLLAPLARLGLRVRRVGTLASHALRLDWR